MLNLRCWLLLGGFFVRMHGLSCWILFIDCRVCLLSQLPCWLFELSFIRVLELSGWEILRHIGPISSDGPMRRGYVLGCCIERMHELQLGFFLFDSSICLLD